MRNRSTRGYKIILMALAILLVMGLMPFAAVSAVNLDAACSITVIPSDSEEGDEAKNLVVDLYKIADAGSLPGQDSYKMVLKDAYASLGTDEDWWKAFENQDQWKEFAQKAAVLAVAQEPDQKGKPVGKLEGLSTGLYLILARGSDLGDDYTATKDEAFVTMAQSDKYTYYYEPVLIAMPTKDPLDGEISTANPTEWLYETSVKLKAKMEIRFGNLRIIKTLTSYETTEDAYFVFKYAYEDFYDHRALNFSEPGTQSVLIKNLPVGAEVTVTENYTGSHYESTTPTSQKVTIVGDETVEVRFANKDYPGGNGGKGAVNSFTYTNGKWEWKKLDDDSASDEEVAK